jgi:transcriptional regulator with XRE-family HTH domain
VREIDDRLSERSAEGPAVSNRAAASGLGGAVGSAVGSATGSALSAGVARRETREPIGRRVARLRAEKGWTQQDLADRLAMSRTAVSHLEADMSQPSERTVLLLAGLFHSEPPAFVAGTLYPESRAERLPLVVARYTEVEMKLSLLRSQLALISDLPRSRAREVVEGWNQQLCTLSNSVLSKDDVKRIAVALRELRDLVL